MKYATCEICGKSFPLRIKLENGKWYRAGGNRHNCFDCKPIRRQGSDAINGEKQCGHCKLTLPLSNFYINSVTRKPKSLCIKCHNHLYDGSRQTTKQIENKKKAIDYKGGKCQRCGYDKFYGALEFHHIDPKSKTLSIGIVRKQNCDFKEWIPELDKCMLLCANCHREKHNEEHLSLKDVTADDE